MPEAGLKTKYKEALMNKFPLDQVPSVLVDANKYKKDMTNDEDKHNMKEFMDSLSRRSEGYKDYVDCLPSKKYDELYDESNRLTIEIRKMSQNLQDVKNCKTVVDYYLHDCGADEKAIDFVIAMLQERLATKVFSF